MVTVASPRERMVWFERDETPIAILFPGQGSQTGDMKQLAIRHCPELVQRATELIGVDPFDHVADGTRFAQPAIFCANIAGWRAIADLGVTGSLMAGHSLGEFAALVAGGFLQADEALDVVTSRGRLMQEVGERMGGGMLAVSGDNPEDGLAELRDLDIVVANYNSPTQIVLSGPIECVDQARVRLKSSGLRAARLPVSGAFHSDLMGPVLPAFRDAMSEVLVRVGNGPTVLCCTTCAPFNDVAGDLVGGLVKPVKWRQTIEAMMDRGVRRFIEVAPGRVLSRLLCRTYGDTVDVMSVSEIETANA